MGGSQPQDAAAETGVRVDFRKLQGERSCDYVELTKKSCLLYGFWKLMMNGRAWLWFPWPVQDVI